MNNMKKLILITVLLVSFLSFGQGGIDPKFINPIPTSKIIDFVDEVNTLITAGGISNANIVAVTEQADFVGADKIFTINSNFALTSNLVLPNNAIVIYGGGVIDVSTYDVTYNNANLTNSKWDFSNGGTVNASSTFSNFHRIELNNYGAVADGKEYFDGVAVSGDATFTSETANFTSADIGKFIAIKGAHSGWLGADLFNSVRSFITTIASVTNSTTVELASAPTRSVSATSFVYGSDNYDVLKQVSLIVNKGVRNLVLGSGVYFRREVSPPDNDNWAADPIGVFFGNGTDDITIEGNNTVLRSIPHNKYKTFSIKTKNTKRFTFKNIVLQGEKPYHQYSFPVSGLADEAVHGIHLSHATITSSWTNSDIIEYEGDGVTSDSDLQFTNYIQGANFTSVNTVSDMTIGDVDDITGARTPNPSSLYTYTTNLIDISGFQFENTRVLNVNRKGNRSYSFSGSSFAGWSGLKTPRYWAYYYDASSTFLYKSGEQRFYDTYEYNDEVKYVVILIETPLDIANINAQVRAPLFAFGANFDNVNIRDCGRHAFSNLPPFSSWKNSKLQRIGPNQPGYGGNIEDYRDAAMYYLFDNIIFTDNAYGDLNFVGTISANVTNCKFLGVSEPNRKKTSAPFITGIGQSGARDSYASFNYMRNVSTELDRRNKFYNNEQLGGVISISANGNTVYNNDFHNVLISNLPTVDVDRTSSHFENNKMTYDKPWTGSLITDTSNSMIYKNIDILLNDKTRTTFEIDQADTFEPIVLESSGNNLLFNSSPTPTLDFGGYFENVRILGARPSLATRDYTYSKIPIIDMKNVHIGTSIVLTTGLPKNRLIENLKVDGALYIQLDQFENTIISATPTIKFKNLILNANDADFNWTNTGSYIFNTNVKNVNIEVLGGEFNLNLTSSITGSFNRYIRLAQLGYILFDNVRFHSETAKVIDFTNTTVVPVGTGAITIKDPILSGISFTLRAGDKLLFTYPNANAPLYVDNATALAALGAGYWYRDSDNSNKLEVTY